MYRIFTRKTWKANPSWPNGYEPNAVPMDSCKTIQETSTRDAAVAICDELNHKWRKHSDRIRFKTATETKKRTYYTASRYEWTEV